MLIDPASNIALQVFKAKSLEEAKDLLPLLEIVLASYPAAVLATLVEVVKNYDSLDHIRLLAYNTIAVYSDGKTIFNQRTNKSIPAPTPGMTTIDYLLSL